MQEMRCNYEMGRSADVTGSRPIYNTAGAHVLFTTPIAKSAQIEDLSADVQKCRLHVEALICGTIPFLLHLTNVDGC
jgi:hypothetical protein